MEKINGTIYKITNPKGKVYIGQTTRPVKVRWNEYRSLQCKNQPKILNSLTYYGVENHTFTVVETGIKSLVELDKKEIFYIAKFDSFNNGLNCTLGGQGYGTTKPVKRSSKKITVTPNEGLRVLDALESAVKISNYVEYDNHIIDAINAVVDYYGDAHGINILNIKKMDYFDPKSGKHLLFKNPAPVKRHNRLNIKSSKTNICPRIYTKDFNGNYHHNWEIRIII